MHKHKHKQHAENEEKLNEAFDRLMKLQSKDIDSMDVQIDEISVGKFSLKGIRLNLAALTTILISVSLVTICLFLLF